MDDLIPHVGTFRLRFGRASRGTLFRHSLGPLGDSP
jgi:hypothetical protein